MSFERFTSKNILINSFLSLCYLGFNMLTTGAKPEHFLLVLIWLAAFYAHEKSRKFILGFVPFIIYWIVYDSMRVVPNYEVSYVHIAEPYELEKSWFGISHLGNIITPNEFFAQAHNRILDFFSGFFYINWVPIPLALGAYLYFKHKDLFIQFSMAFLLVNLLGFVIYYIYPAAPPWYVEKYGFDLQIGVPGDRAGLARFDTLIGYPLFEGIYNKNANVLAAMPSLHSTYPLIVLFYAIKAKMKYLNIFFVIFCLGIWFSAVYSNHHYILDVLAGIVLTIVTIIAFEWLLRRPFIKQWMHGYLAKI